MVAGTELTTADPQDDLIEPESPRSGDLADPEGAGPWWREPRSWAVLVSLLLWAVPFTHATGGRDPFALTWALLALLPAVVLVAPWRHLRRRELLALLPAGAALLLCVVGRTGFDGATTTAALSYAGVLYLLVRGYLVAGGRAALVASAVLIAGLDQFVAGWWPWYGRGESAALMVGTFYWHNQFAVFVAAAGILGLVIAARGSRRVRLLGGAAALVAVPALAFAGSRSTLAVFALLWLAMLLVSLRRRRAVLTLLLLPLAGLALTAALAGPLFMTSSSSVASNVEQRETVVGNGNARLTYDRIALDLLERRPLTGTGFGTFAGASAPTLPPTMQPTLYVHNGFAQAFVDGGVLLGGAVLVVALLPIAILTRRFWRERLGRRGDQVDPVALGAFGALVLLALHSVVDVDWTYPALLAMFAVLAGLGLGARTEPLAGEATPSAPGPGFAAGAIVVTLLVALPVSVLAGAPGATAGAVPGWAKVASFGLSVTDPPGWADSASVCAARLRAALADPARDAAARARIASDVACLQAPAQDVPSTQMLRARGLMALGATDEARRLARDEVTRHGERIPQLLVIEAVLPADGGDPEAARRQLSAVLEDPRVAASLQAQALAQGVLDALPTSASGGGSTTRKDQ